ncbi:hypothetical protein PILCRDRAFT_14062 [Piloderma croceum F 1598]|uniref:Uncharacterized protein n=1 Tax=Piloderma croceum (strain F 1598) TaxID=765440 RepID=A0A0C3BC38_PILCF|nr:hypothetical protein PILCRDRAFT_14062 [Piloderma croceum F 1598]
MSTTPPTSPSHPRYHTPTTPLKHDPNSHPYAIKTTSTALLTRSNSSPYNAAQQGRHYYVPLTSRVRKESVCEADNKDVPAPLPIPPSPTDTLPNAPYTRDRRNTTHSFSPSPSTHSSLSPPPPARTRTNTLASSSFRPPISSHTNPQTWSPTDLSTYLQSAPLLLRSQSSSGESGEREAYALPARMAMDLAAWVRKEGMGGKKFLEGSFEE